MFDDYDNEGVLGITKHASLSDRLPRGYLSVSQISQFMKCGQAYYFRYIEEITIPRNSFMVQGSALHKAAEKMHIAMMEGGMAPPLAYVESVYSDTHEEYFDNEVVIMEEDISVGNTKDVGMAMIRHYYKAAAGELLDLDTKARIPPVYPVAVERVVRTMLQPIEGEPVPFMGVIDLEEPTAVADLKTKRKKGNQGEVDNSLQLSLYAYVANKPHVRMDMLVKPTKTMGPRYFRMESTRTPQEIVHAIEIASGVASDIVKGRFPLTMPDNWWCTVDWCPYWDRCRGRKH